MDTAMTTFARGVPATKRAVGVFTNFGSRRSRESATSTPTWDVRSAITAGKAERRAIKREQAWIDRAAFAAMRITPRG